MQAISKVRFEALAAYCRRPQTSLISQELSWHQAYDESILVTIIIDLPDQDYAGILLAQDLDARYRWVNMTDFFDSPDQALEAANELVHSLFHDLEANKVQGDETGKPVDFFTPIVPTEKLNRDFHSITSLIGYSPAVSLITPMMRWHQDTDGNFIEQFQTTGFNARLWELYLFAMLVENGFAIDNSNPVPDFQATSLSCELCIEATSVNPSRDSKGELVPPPQIDTPAQMQAFLQHYMPIRFAGPLIAKLEKRYWENVWVKNKPLVFAIQDFHAPLSMTVSGPALPIYLYGYQWVEGRDAQGRAIVVPERIGSHVWGTKDVPSGFFNLEGAENISAVIENSSATISKFNRMGVLAGFGSEDIELVRTGMAIIPAKDPTPVEFTQHVNDAEYNETWVEGMNVFHNPRALHPLEPNALPGASHHWLADDGQLTSLVPDWRPVTSVTQIIERS